MPKTRTLARWTLVATVALIALGGYTRGSGSGYGQPQVGTELHGLVTAFHGIRIDPDDFCICPWRSVTR